MRVAAAQARPVWLDRAATTAKVIDLISEAGGRGVELLAFPEAFLSGYPAWVCRTDGASFENPLQKRAYGQYLDSAVELSGPELRAIADAVARYGVFTLLGVSERGEGPGRGTVYCTLVAIDPERGIVGVARGCRSCTGTRAVLFLMSIPQRSSRSIWQVDPNSGELIVSPLLTPRPSQSPATRRRLFVVYVKALVRHRSVRTPGLAVLLSGELGMMGENVGIHHHPAPR